MNSLDIQNPKKGQIAMHAAEVDRADEGAMREAFPAAAGSDAWRVILGQLGDGRNLGRYDLFEPIGEGATAVIFRGMHRGLRTPVAVKVFKPNLRDRARKKALAEARLMAGLDHPNIVRVLDVEEHGDLPYIVFEFVGEMTLDEMLHAAGPMAPRHVARLADEIGSALAYASQKSIVHCDVKPSNILIRSADGAAKLADFGGAATPDDERASKREGSPGKLVRCLTYVYAAPECLLGEAIDHRADMYSLGVTLFDAATGQPPFIGRTKADTINAHLMDEPPRIADVCPAMDATLAAVIDRLLAKDPAARFPTWRAYFDAIGPAYGDGGVSDG